MEKNFVVDRFDLEKIHCSLSLYYGDKLQFATSNGKYDLNISFSEENVYVNLIENIYYDNEYPKDFIEQMNREFSSPLYLFLSTNNAKRGEEFLNLLCIDNFFFY